MTNNVDKQNGKTRTLPFEPELITVDFCLNASLHDDTAEPEGYANRISGKIMAVPELADEETKDKEIGPVKIGTIEVVLGRFRRAVDNQVSICEVADSYGELEAAWSCVCDHSTGDWRDDLLDRYEIKGFDLLVIEEVQVIPAWRGHDIGLAAIQRAIDWFGQDVGLVAIQPHPLQFGRNHRKAWIREMHLDHLTDEKACFKKLQDYYARLGFEHVGNGIYALSPSQQVLRVLLAF